ncbi:hypothetical protein H0H92_014530 [Tricholoma furcatifolium]|nr:hypothetical protein H0H92_014530 [Tricholoma furcatifolium]
MRFTSAILLLVSCVTGVHSVVVARHSKACPSIPATLEYNATFLPDPFTFADGTPVINLEDWDCRRSEISTLLQVDELGVNPAAPPIINVSLSPASPSLGSTADLSITCALNASQSITFTPTITYPTSGSSPFPAIIAFDGLSIPVPSGIAVITLAVSDLAQQDSSASRGIGQFYDLYGSSASAGALTAFAWGTSRVIDALELTPSALIDVTHVGVTGCSRDGKGAVVAGAFDDRIVLTIPQESGSGGTDCWRISDALLAGGLDTQTASEIVQENVWFSTAFDAFANTSVDALPFDHHMLMGLIAPRGLFVIDNIGYDWLGAQSSWGCTKTAQRIWDALGEGFDVNVGISQAAPHLHCEFPSEQEDVLNAFINKFLLDMDADTNVSETAGNYSFTTPGTWDPWSTPNLQ